VVHPAVAPPYGQYMISVLQNNKYIHQLIGTTGPVEAIEMDDTLPLIVGAISNKAIQ